MLSEPAVGFAEIPCVSPACPPDRAPIPRVSYATSSPGSRLPRVALRGRRRGDFFATGFRDLAFIFVFARVDLGALTLRVVLFFGAMRRLLCCECTIPSPPASAGELRVLDFPSPNTIIT